MASRIWTNPSAKLEGGSDFLSLYVYLSLSYLALNKVADPRLRHHGDGHGRHDLFDHLRIRHSRDATLDADIGGDTLQRHYSDGAGLFCDPCLWGGGGKKISSSQSVVKTIKKKKMTQR